MTVEHSGHGRVLFQNTGYRDGQDKGGYVYQRLTELLPEICKDGEAGGSGSNERMAYSAIGTILTARSAVKIIRSVSV